VIEVIGRRPGEKLVEDLVDPEEEPVPSRYPGITVSRPPVPDRPTLRRSLRELETLVDERRTDELAQRVKVLATGARADDLVTMAEAR
jgi:FlaA1/EpsC-like NDP-sugar epimerase